MPEPTTNPGTDPNANPTPAAGGNGGTPPAATTETPRTFTQAELDAVIKDRLERQQRALDAKTAKDRADAEAAQLAEQGKYKELAESAQRKAAELETRLAERDHRDLQRDVAAEYKLPAEMATRLQGSTRDELAADAKALAKLVAPPATAAPGSTPSPRPGQGSNKTLIEQETERMRASGKYSRA